MAIVALPKDQYGTFYDTDCYVIYSASQQGQLSGTDVIVSLRHNKSTFPDSVYVTINYPYEK